MEESSDGNDRHATATIGEEAWVSTTSRLGSIQNLVWDGTMGTSPRDNTATKLDMPLATSQRKAKPEVNPMGLEWLRPHFPVGGAISQDQRGSRDTVADTTAATVECPSDDNDKEDVSEETDASSSESDDDLNSREPIFFAAKVSTCLQKLEATEQDIIRDRCAVLRKQMRKRVTLPVHESGAEYSCTELDSGRRLPLYSCPFTDCNFSCHDRTNFLHHITGGLEDPRHREMLLAICKEDHEWMSILDYVYGAATIAEQERWPRLGLSVTRRSLHVLCERFNDSSTQCICCFVCTQLRTTCKGYGTAEDPTSGNAEIAWFSQQDLDDTGIVCFKFHRIPFRPHTPPFHSLHRTWTVNNGFQKETTRAHF